MKQIYAWLQLTALAAVLALTTTPGVRALPKFQPPRPLIDLEGRVIDCPDFLEPQVELVPYTFIVGYPLVGFTVKISAEHVKFHGKAMPACGFPDYIAPLPSFSWSIESRPVGSVAELVDTTSLTPRLPIDKEGEYVVLLTVCPGPDGCTIQPPGSHLAPVHVDSQFVEIPIEARESAPLAPETTPAVPQPPDDAGHTTPVDRCDGLIPGVLAKQWWAVDQIETPYDYRQLDGFVRGSRVARMDDPFNHGWPGPVIQDTNYHVVPDLKYTDLLFEEFNPDNPQAIEVEWERRSIPERYRPTAGDRVSIIGYWDTDCGHDRPEIHPPVGIAVHRPRPIRIPDGATFPELGDQAAGTGIYVPGIITDIFFSEDGGDLVDCDTDTGLANANLVPGPNGTLGPDCVPAPSLDHVFEFDVYLPRNPRATMRQAGFQVPPVPLYVKSDTVTGGPAPENRSPAGSAGPPRLPARQAGPSRLHGSKLRSSDHSRLGASVCGQLGARPLQATPPAARGKRRRRRGSSWRRRLAPLGQHQQRLQRELREAGMGPGHQSRRRQRCRRLRRPSLGDGPARRARRTCRGPVARTRPAPVPRRDIPVPGAAGLRNPLPQHRIRSGHLDR